MARISALDLWMNGERVGRWERSPSGRDKLTYIDSWQQTPHARPISLSLPITGSTLSGEVVTSYFENLIPDNQQILKRLRERFNARSTGAFDLLAEIGRDCAGALQLVPADSEPSDVRNIDAEPVDDAGIAQILRSATLPHGMTGTTDDAFRLSLAGAQEKTALLYEAGQWCVPRGSTPSSHLFKLPLGVVGNVRADLRDSVEMEWLSLELVGELGIPVAKARIGQFEDQKALVVERFDRRRSSSGDWWIRVPQEDFCQVTGLPPHKKYEADGGPGISAIMEKLRSSDEAAEDRRQFFKAQLVFWLMAATDGHAKNFSIFLLPQGHYRLTPLYDVISTYPILGNAAGQLNPRDAKLAMAVQGRNRHYRLTEIHRWHWIEMGKRLGLGKDAEAIVQELLEERDKPLERISARLPKDFPMHIYFSIAAGYVNALSRLDAEPSIRTRA
jgi:serine/threonine-protein kinase HipA